MSLVLELPDDLSFLIIDESDSFRNVMAAGLKSLGFKFVSQAPSSMLALESLRTKSINFVICELEMPVINGIELLKEIIVGNQQPENVILLEILPHKQKTRIDFYCTQDYLGIPIVCLTELIQEGKKLYYEKSSINHRNTFCSYDTSTRTKSLLFWSTTPSRTARLRRSRKSVKTRHARTRVCSWPTTGTATTAASAT